MLLIALKLGYLRRRRTKITKGPVNPCFIRGLSSNWTENRVKPDRGSHFFLPLRIFPPSTTFSPSLRSVPSGATCR